MYLAPTRESDRDARDKLRAATPLSDFRLPFSEAGKPITADLVDLFQSIVTSDSSSSAWSGRAVQQVLSTADAVLYQVSGL